MESKIKYKNHHNCDETITQINNYLLQNNFILSQEDVDFYKYHAGITYSFCSREVLQSNMSPYFEVFVDYYVQDILCGIKNTIAPCLVFSKKQ
jgi:hypothetical protein